MVTQGDGVRGDKLGDQDQQIQTTVYKIDKLYSTRYSVSYNKL